MKKVGFVMDSIARINVQKDSTFAMMLECMRRNWHIFYMQANDIFYHDNKVYANMQRIYLYDKQDDYYCLEDSKVVELANLDCILLRKDPPFDIDYIYLTYLLERVVANDCVIINNPRSVRDANEKLFTLNFPECCPKTLVSSCKKQIMEFASCVQDIIIKPLDSMGGNGVFHLLFSDPNLSVAIETLTNNGKRCVMAQKFIPEIVYGDKRILMINGEPLDYALARIPAANDFRGNLAAGATFEGRKLTTRDKWLCTKVGPELCKRGLFFVGVDVIGDYITEINVTSPTCIRELDRLFKINIAGQFFDFVNKQLLS